MEKRTDILPDRLLQRFRGWWYGRQWRKLQREFHKSGTRYYGDGGTIHRSGFLDVETFEGQVVAVWFRCQTLPFQQTEVDEERFHSMSCGYRDCPPPELRGVEVKEG